VQSHLSFQDPVKVSDVDILGLVLGKSIYSKEQMEEFVRFQDSQNTKGVAELATWEGARSVGPWPHEPRQGSDSGCGGISPDTTVPADQTNGSYHHPRHVHCEHGENAAGHPGESHRHRQGTPLPIWDVRGIMGHGLSGRCLPNPLVCA